MPRSPYLEDISVSSQVATFVYFAHSGRDVDGSMFNLQDELENTATLDAIQEWSISDGIDVPSASSSQVSQALNRALFYA